MPIEDALIVFVGMVLVCGIVAAANYAERERHSGLHRFVMGSMVILSVLLVLVMSAQVIAAYSSSDSSASSSTGTVDSPDKLEAWAAFLIAVVTTGFVTALAFRSVREMIAAVFPRQKRTELSMPSIDDRLWSEPGATANPAPTPLFPQMLNYYTTDSVILPSPSNSSSRSQVFDNRWDQKAERRGAEPGSGYNPYSVVHTAALMLSLFFLSTQIIGFVLSGGLEGIAENYASGLSAWAIVLNGLPQIIIPIVGVGLGVRRNLSQTLKRLGLEIPTFEQLGVGFGVVIVLFIFIIAVAIVWQGLVSEETFEEQSQASEALSDSVDTLWMAFLIAAMAGISEEIAFRGALQPIFGLWPTAILFALFHMQYTLTPATLIILGVALGFGWLRLKYNTTVAILAHFLYNFVQLALAVSMPDEAASWITYLF